jgi:hypothetical protein
VQSPMASTLPWSEPRRAEAHRGAPSTMPSSFADSSRAMARFASPVRPHATRLS